MVRPSGPRVMPDIVTRHLPSQAASASVAPVGRPERWPLPGRPRRQRCCRQWQIRQWAVPSCLRSYGGNRRHTEVIRETAPGDCSAGVLQRPQLNWVGSARQAVISAT